MLQTGHFSGYCRCDLGLDLVRQEFSLWEMAQGFGGKLGPMEMWPKTHSHTSELTLASSSRISATEANR